MRMSNKSTGARAKLFHSRLIHLQKDFKKMFISTSKRIFDLIDDGLLSIDNHPFSSRAFPQRALLLSSRVTLTN